MGVIEADEGTFIVSGGDLRALEKIRANFNLKDKASVILFALGLLYKANGKPLSFPTSEVPWEMITLSPADALRSTSEPTEVTSGVLQDRE